jgi:hypothetical protein
MQPNPKTGVGPTYAMMNLERRSVQDRMSDVGIHGIDNAQACKVLLQLTISRTNPQ